ncbi:hypothetical protein P9112_014241 [Eukaryota sp. TZLM1-RC]
MNCEVCCGSFQRESRMPLVICKTGHNVCSECDPQLPSCPFCRDDRLPSTIRNLALMNAIEELSAKFNSHNNQQQNQKMKQEISIKSLVNGVFFTIIRIFILFCVIRAFVSSFSTEKNVSVDEAWDSMDNQHLDCDTRLKNALHQIHYYSKLENNSICRILKSLSDILFSVIRQFYNGLHFLARLVLRSAGFLLTTVKTFAPMFIKFLCHSIFLVIAKIGKLILTIMLYFVERLHRWLDSAHEYVGNDAGEL